jgi:hypothetical protein
MNTRPTLAEPVICSEFWANRRGETVRIQLREYQGIIIVDIRRHYTAADGKMLPTRKGISLVIARLPDLAKAIGQAERKARELGLINKAAEGRDAAESGND